MAYFYSFEKKTYSILSEVVLAGNDSIYDTENDQENAVAHTMNAEHKLVIIIIWSILIITGAFGMKIFIFDCSRSLNLTSR